jgi:hypothetical protein
VGLIYSVSRDASEPVVQLLPGFDSIHMPIARNVALVLHRLDNVPQVQRATREMVAVVNATTVAFAERFICSSTPDFFCRLPNGQLGNAEETMEALRALSVDPRAPRNG